MSVYMTEQEQLEAIKKWWQKHNGKIIVILSVIFLFAAGYKYWNWHQEKVSQQASNSYEQLMLAFSNQDNKKIQAFSNQLIKEYEHTVYADAAHLSLAKYFAEKGKFLEAKVQLESVAAHSKIIIFQQVAKIRIARLLIAEKSYDKALDVLSSLDDSPYQPLVYELKGDAFAAKGQYNKAIASYRKAINNNQTQRLGNLMLEMKTNEVAALTRALKTSNERKQAA